MTNGTLIVSLDFELMWGVSDRVDPSSPYARNIRGEREAIPLMLAAFEQHGVHATWATVGLLFADNRRQVEKTFKEVSPSYTDAHLRPNLVHVGADEAADPLHYGGSLIDRILDTPGQEVGSHSAIHLNAQAPGIDKACFKRDTAAAVTISRSKGVRPRSYVFPRNQIVPSFLDILRSNGFTSYRSSQPGWAHRVTGTARRNPFVRAGRVASDLIGRLEDRAHAPPAPANGAPAAVAASFFLRPSGMPRALDQRFIQRIEGALTIAAMANKTVHLWWHPHNFGGDPPREIRRLERILRHFESLQDQYGMRSRSMGEIVESGA